MASEDFMGEREAGGTTDFHKRLKKINKLWSLEDREMNWCRIEQSKQRNCGVLEHSTWRAGVFAGTCHSCLEDAGTLQSLTITASYS